LSKKRKELEARLEAKRKVGMENEETIFDKLAQYDALEATQRMRVYALISTAIAAISVIASAVAAYFAYAAQR
jgi:hypothetical protein